MLLYALILIFNLFEFVISQVFIGNYDRDNTVIQDLKQSIRARYFRFQPQTWHFYDICLRVEMYTRPGMSLLSDQQVSSQGLLVYLNFDRIHDHTVFDLSKQRNSAEIGKRTEVNKASSSCGHVARLNNGSEVLLDGEKMKVTKEERKS